MPRPRRAVWNGVKSGGQLDTNGVKTDAKDVRNGVIRGAEAATESLGMALAPLGQSSPVVGENSRVRALSPMWHLRSWLAPHRHWFSMFVGGNGNLHPSGRPLPDRRSSASQRLRAVFHVLATAFSHRRNMPRFVIATIVLAAIAALCIGCAPAEASIVVTVDKSAQRLSVAIDGSLRYQWPVSTARWGYSTPNGSYRPERLARKWFSRKYDWSPMPYSIFFDGGYAIHGSYELALSTVRHRTAASDYIHKTLPSYSR